MDRPAESGDACTEFHGDSVTRRFPVGADEERGGRVRGVGEEHSGVRIAAKTGEVYRGFASGPRGPEAEVEAKSQKRSARDRKLGLCAESMEGRVGWSGKVKLNGHGSKDATGVAASRRGSIADKAVRVADSVVDGPVHGGELVGYGLLFFESCLSSRFCWIFWWRWRNLWRRRRLFGRQLIFVRSIVSFVLWREDVRRRLFGHFLVSFLSGRWRRCRCSRPLELRLKTAGGRVERISVQLRCQLLC